MWRWAACRPAFHGGFFMKLLRLLPSARVTILSGLGDARLSSLHTMATAQQEIICNRPSRASLGSVKLHCKHLTAVCSVAFCCECHGRIVDHNCHQKTLRNVLMHFGNCRCACCHTSEFSEVQQWCGDCFQTTFWDNIIAMCLAPPLFKLQLQRTLHLGILA